MKHFHKQGIQFKCGVLDMLSTLQKQSRKGQKTRDRCKQRKELHGRPKNFENYSASFMC